MRLHCIEKSPGPEFSLNRVLNYEFISSIDTGLMRFLFLFTLTLLSSL